MRRGVAIVGGGMGGLTAALALRSAGIEATVYEQAPELAEVGAGLTLSPNATRVLDRLGLGAGIERLGTIPPRQAVLHWRTGAILVDTERGRLAHETYGAHYVQIHRADLQALLRDALLRAAPGSIRTGHRVVRLDDRGDRVLVGFEDGTGIEASLVVGCDGVRSTVRGHVVEEPPPEFTHHVAWRGVVPRALVRPEHLEPASGILMGPGRMFARYVIRGGALVNVVALARQHDWSPESWSLRADPREAIGEFAGWHPSVAAILSAMPPEHCFKWALFRRRPLGHWSRGRVTLLGDAAHPILPFMGQGAAMAIEDAMVLARCLAGWPDAGEALRRYEAARVARTTAVQEESTAKGERMQSLTADDYDRAKHRNEESIGLFSYDAHAVPV